MELRQLRAFVSVVEAGSFTGAAERLVVVQSAVSATIRGLERELGALLFDRSTRRVKLTDAGRALLPEARATLQAARLAGDAVHQTQGGLRGRVSIGLMRAAPSPGRSIAAFIASFQAAHPLVEIDAHHVDGSQRLADQVRDGALDMALLSLPGEQEGITLTQLTAEPVALLCRPDHSLAGHRDVALRELQPHAFVDSPVGWGNRLLVDNACVAAGVTRRLRYELNDISTIVDFVREGLAIALLSPQLVQYTGDDIRFVALQAPPIFRSFLATPSQLRQTAAAQAFAESIVTHAVNTL